MSIDDFSASDRESNMNRPLNTVAKNSFNWLKLNHNKLVFIKYFVYQTEKEHIEKGPVNH
jgi:hypothetical protein